MCLQLWMKRLLMNFWINSPGKFPVPVAPIKTKPISCRPKRSQRCTWAEWKRSLSGEKLNSNLRGEKLNSQVHFVQTILFYINKELVKTRQRFSEIISQNLNNTHTGTLFAVVCPANNQHARDPREEKVARIRHGWIFAVVEKLTNSTQLINAIHLPATLLKKKHNVISQTSSQTSKITKWCNT